MVTTTRRTGLIRRNFNWFDPAPRFDRKTTYIQSPVQADPRGYHVENWSTLVVDLSRSPDELLVEMNKTTRTHIRQFEEQDHSFRIVTSVDRFVSFFNAFAAEKEGVAQKTSHDLTAFGEHLVMTAIGVAGEELSMHSYIVDRDQSRARLLHSGSIRFFETKELSANLIGKGNRYHHWADMRYFAENGFRWYDFGGYAPDSDDPLKSNIAVFKRGFGGGVESFCHYIPSWIYALSRFRGNAS
jgi:hypothetical protein